MVNDGAGDRGAKRRPVRREGGKPRYVPRRKVCAFCVDKVQDIDYKDVPRLRRFLSDRGKIEPRRKTGTCALHQRVLTIALKRARHLALLPYTAEHVRELGGPAVERSMAPGRGFRSAPPPQEPPVPAPAAAPGPAPAASEGQAKSQ
ncbi:MAG: 30S ribosomal protein S18 [Chloroflexi bacterium]|nr:30S ribosomal protein S18 [Chloroflexota bacterium]